MSWDQFIADLQAKGWNDNDFAALAGKQGQEFIDVVNFINGLKQSGANNSVDNLIRTRFPQMAWAMANPELGPMLRRAVAEGWDPARLQGELLNTGWYRATAETERQWDRRVAEDPAEAAKQYNISLSRVQRLAEQVGVTLTPDQAQSLALSAGRSGWEDQQLLQALVDRATFTGDRGATGQINAAVDAVKQTAANYFAPIPDQTAFDLARKMISGTMDRSSMEAYFKDLATARFQNNSQIVNMINRGMTPSQIFAPYVQQTAQLLEVSPSAVDLNDPKFSQILDHTDANGNTRPMSLTEAGQYVRGLNDYKQTQGAVSQAADFAEFIGQRMGRVG